MVVQTLDIPTEYIPYDRVNFCSNILINVRYLINDKDFYPLLIGKGNIPKIWIYAKEQNRNSTKLVEKSISLLPSVLSVNINDDSKRLSVVSHEKSNQTTILEIDYYSNEVLNVEQLDLRPIGYNIIGNKDGLLIGNNTVKRNTLQGVQSFIGLE